MDTGETIDEETSARRAKWKAQNQARMSNPVHVAKKRLRARQQDAHPTPQRLAARIANAAARRRRIRANPVALSRERQADSARKRRKTSRNQSALLARLRRVVPASLPKHIQDDVVGAMALALAAQRLKPIDIERKRETSSAGRIRRWPHRRASAARPSIRKPRPCGCDYWKQNSPYETVSLDAPIGDGATTYLDLLSEDQGLANFV